MHDQHEPRNEFVDRLEWHITREVRRRNRSTQSYRSIPLWRTKALLGILLLIVGSMAVGGVVVAASYQAENNERRDLLVSAYERRAELARHEDARGRRLDASVVSPLTDHAVSTSCSAACSSPRCRRTTNSRNWIRTSTGRRLSTPTSTSTTRS